MKSYDGYDSYQYRTSKFGHRTSIFQGTKFSAQISIHRNFRNIYRNLMIFASIESSRRDESIDAKIVKIRQVLRKLRSIEIYNARNK